MFAFLRQFLSNLESRPTQCRTYPFWASNIIGPSEWEAEAASCEGISLGRVDPTATTSTTSTASTNAAVAVGKTDASPSMGLVDAVKIKMVDSSPVVPADAIWRQVILHQVHARGQGPDWTYQQAQELFAATEEQGDGGDVVSEFAEDFTRTHHSELLFESNLIRIVDSTAPQAGKDEEKEEDDDENVNADGEEEEEEEEEEEQVLVTTRRMEIRDCCNTIKTEMEVKKDLSGKKKSVDHSKLLHGYQRLIARVCQLGIQDLTAAGVPLNLYRVSVLGAGGCALPSYLSKRSGLAVSRIRIEAVEPQIELLHAAKDYFDALFTVNIDAFIEEPIDYLRSLKERQVKSDLLVVDAFEVDDLVVVQHEEEESVDGQPAEIDGNSDSRDVRAPTLSLIQDPSLFLDALSPQGILAMNIHGSEEWASFVQDTIGAHEGFGRPVLVEFPGMDNSVLFATSASNQENLLRLLATVVKECDDQSLDAGTIFATWESAQVVPAAVSPLLPSDSVRIVGLE